MKPDYNRDKIYVILQLMNMESFIHYRYCLFIKHTPFYTLILQKCKKNFLILNIYNINKK